MADEPVELTDEDRRLVELITAKAKADPDANLDLLSSIHASRLAAAIERRDRLEAELVSVRRTIALRHAAITGLRRD